MISCREIILHYWNERKSLSEEKYPGGVENEDKNQMRWEGGEMVSTFLKQG